MDDYKAMKHLYEPFGATKFKQLSFYLLARPGATAATTYLAPSLGFRDFSVSAPDWVEEV